MISAMVSDLMIGTAQMEVKLPFTSSHSVAWLSAISLLFYFSFFIIMAAPFVWWRGVF